MRPSDLGARADWLARLRDGDGAAYEVLLREHGPAVRETLFLLLGEGSEADEALREVFLEARRSVRDFAGDVPVGAWLNRLAVSIGRGRLRRRGQAGKIGSRGYLPDFDRSGIHARPVSRWKDLPADERSLALLELVRGSVDRLMDQLRLPLLLHDVERLEDDELAYILGLPLGTARRRLQRARHVLRALIASTMQASDPA